MSTALHFAPESDVRALRKLPNLPCWLIIVTLKSNDGSPGAWHIGAPEMATPTPIPCKLITHAGPVHPPPDMPCVSLPLSHRRLRPIGAQTKARVS